MEEAPGFRLESTTLRRMGSPIKRGLESVAARDRQLSQGPTATSTPVQDKKPSVWQISETLRDLQLETQQINKQLEIMLDRLNTVPIEFEENELGNAPRAVCSCSKNCIAF